MLWTVEKRLAGKLPKDARPVGAGSDRSPGGRGQAEGVEAYMSHRQNPLDGAMMGAIWEFQKSGALI